RFIVLTAPKNWPSPPAYDQCRLLRAFVSNGTSWALTLPAQFWCFVRRRQRSPGALAAMTITS
ncbi:MAG TPA: hypothetical protein VK604_15700, partial [Bryobacteraceae bacterium]|nr:hypothetical protein [Bryobacteraceae bacterium]